MALFKFLKGNSANLPSTSTAGWVYVTEDTHDMYIFKTDSEKFQLNANYANALRVADNGALYGVGSKTKPVYFLNGIPNECDTYGGGTAVTLNGASKAASTASFYAPAGAGTSGQVLTSSGAAPGWTNQANLNVGSAAKWTNKRTLSIQGSVTGSAEIDGSGDITLNTITNHTHLYAGSSTAGGSANSAVKLDSDAGSGTLPVYFSGGKPVACGTSLAVSVTGSAAKWTTARTITLAGAVTGSVSLDGSANVTLNTTTNHSHSYLPLAGGKMNGVITGKTELASARLQNTASGYHQIFINSPTAWMTAFTIRVYQAYKWSDIVISGYNYGSSHWYSPSAVLMGSSTAESIPVTFGYTSDYNLWVAIPASNYYGIEIIDCVNGYTAFDSWADLFTISNVSTLSGTSQTTITATRPWHRGESVTSAVWNDYAECREADTIEPGYVLIETGDDTLTKSAERLSHFAGVSSDTWGFSQGETDKAKTPIAVAGRVLVYPYQNRNNYKPGDCVCAAPGGTVDIMTREEVIQWPDRIVGTVSCVPDYEEWGGGETADRDPVKVNGRIWIKVR